VTRQGADAPTLSEGLTLAKQAARARSQAYIWDTLAEAYGRSGQAAQAHAAALKALQLAEKGEGLGEMPLDTYRQRVTAFPWQGATPELPEAATPAEAPALGGPRRDANGTDPQKSAPPSKESRRPNGQPRESRQSKPVPTLPASPPVGVRMA
jgi:hypothetical protein